MGIAQTDSGPYAPVLSLIMIYTLRRDLRKLTAQCSEVVVDADEIVKIADDVDEDMSSPAIAHWGVAARKQRAKKTTATRVARHRKNVDHGVRV